MEIKPPSSQLYTSIARSVASATPNSLANTTPPDWKISQLIDAIITRITDKQLFLDIQGIKANTAKPQILDLKIGDILKLQIEQLKPMPQFKIISLEKPMNTQVITQALKSALFQNTSLNPLLKNISYVANRPALQPSPLAADVNAAVRNIFKNLPSPYNLKTVSQVKNTIENSGLYIENKFKNEIFSLLQGSSSRTHNLKTSLSSDLSAQLHRLANLIRTQLVPTKSSSPINTSQVNPNTVKQAAPPIRASIEQSAPTIRAPIEQASLQTFTVREEAMQNFLRQIETSLSHLQHTQLQNLNESQAGRPTWLFELPIKNGQDIDVFELRITEEESAQGEEKAKKIWNVTLQFDLAGLGKIKAHIKMMNEQISTQFYSESSDILSLFQQNFDFLRSRLRSNGLNVGELKCAHAILSKESSPIQTKQLDERT